MDLQSGFKEIASSLGEWQQNGLNEAQTATAIVIRVLYLLGYNIWDPYEVVAQEIGNSGIPDFIVKVQNKRRFVIEVKKLGSLLDSKTKTQAVSYANNQAIRWAILTNGNEWQLFDSFMRKEAHERRILSLSFAELDTDLLTQYFSRLLSRDRWAEDEPDARLEHEARDIHSHIQLSSELQPLALELKEVMREFTVQDPEAGLKLLEVLHKWDAEKLAFVRKNWDLFKPLSAFAQEPKLQALTPSQAAASTLSLVDALRQGIELTSPPKRAAKSSGLEAWLDGEPCSATSWRDIRAGIAEAFLLLDKETLLEEKALIYSNPTERKRGGEKPYPISSYRQLSSGKYLFLHDNVTGHRSHIVRFLHVLGASVGLLRVRYKGKEYRLP